MPLIVVLGVVLAVQMGSHLGITIVVGNSMEPALESGDLVVTRKQPNYAISDVIVYRIPAGEPGEGARVIHRITGGTADGFETAGDHREGVDLWRPSVDDVVGSPVLTIPGGGLAILWLRSPLVLGALVAAAAFWFALTLPASDLPPKPPERPADRCGRELHRGDLQTHLGDGHEGAGVAQRIIQCVVRVLTGAKVLPVRGLR